MSRIRVREMGLELGTLPAGKHNAITDVEGVGVGHSTFIERDSIRTGVTAIVPHQGNLYEEKVTRARTEESSLSPFFMRSHLIFGAQRLC